VAELDWPSRPLRDGGLWGNDEEHRRQPSWARSAAT
jgi:hypothetical protein